MYTTLIQSQELYENLYNPEWIIVDSRYDLLDKPAGYKAYLEAHIPGAVYADLEQDLSGPPLTNKGRHPLPTSAKLSELFCSLGIDSEKQVIVYDSSSGAIASRLWWMLKYMGHEAVAVLDGGWQSWLSAHQAVMQGEEKNTSTIFHGEAHPEWIVSIDEVPLVSRMIDSREPPRYRGEVEPIDPIAGHIPGAVNHFWKANINEEGYYLEPRQLRQMMSEAYGSTAANEVVFYCGSGVTACQNILAVVHAGLPMPRLYAGSWSEWSSLPDNPVAKGDK